MNLAQFMMAYVFVQGPPGNEGPSGPRGPSGPMVCIEEAFECLFYVRLSCSLRRSQLKNVPVLPFVRLELSTFLPQKQ